METKMIQTVYLMVTLAALVSCQQQTRNTFSPWCEHPFAWIRDPYDCTHFWRCVWGRSVEMPRCPSRTVLSTKLNVCVFPGSIWDDCNTRPPRTTRRPPVTTSRPQLTGRPNPPPLTPQERCARGDGLFPHPEFCQLYYNCSHVYTTVPRFFEQNMQECTYPQSFDATGLRCRDFSQVNCGERTEAFEKCEYRRHWCPVAHCIPCSVDNPSCLGKEDGLHPYPGREWSPNFIECRAGRTDRTEQCERDINYQVPQFFNPEMRKCIHLFRIPRERGGLQPSCEGRFDGAYPVEEGTPGVSFICSGRRLLNIRYCPQGSVGRPEPRTCIYS